MAVRPLCVEPQPVLRRPAKPIQRFTKDVARLVEDLIDTMYANDGIGLAAPQIGCEVQVFVANPSRRRGQEFVMVNPALEDASGRAGIVEGCLSLPDVWEKVRRAARVRMRGDDASGATRVVKADGLLAIVLQHELDHLDGRLLVDRLSWWRRALARKRKK